MVPERDCDPPEPGRFVRTYPDMPASIGTNGMNQLSRTRKPEKGIAG